ncbi:MAG: YihY/virulence factor BrkB family protein [Desulfobacterales bacterium]|jgi:membrane protein|nr:YihY/virulence factor BrkB family protein [Desulfobacterales bacterium]
MTISTTHRIRASARAAKAFFVTGLWQLNLEELPRGKALGVRLMRAVMVAVAEFFKDQCMLRASALTFYTLLSIVPVFAVIFGIAKGFGLERLLEKELMEQLAGQEQALERILAFSRRLLENTRGGVMAGVGVAMMLWSAVKVLGNIESAFNAMWDVKKARSWWRKFSDYMALMVFSPILLIVAGSATVFIRTQIDDVSARFALTDWLAPLVLAGFRLTPLLLVWMLFTLLYLVMPNTRVSFKAALAGGIAGGSIFQLVQWAYIAFQVGVANFNAIYGSFAALPLFIVWVQTSWTLVLFGAELCFAFEHAGTYCSAAGCPELAPGERKLLALRIARRVIQDFAAGREPPTVAQIARGLKMPARRVEPLAAELARCGVLTETRSRKKRQPAFQPATDIHRLTLQKIIDAYEGAAGEDGVSPARSQEARDLEEALRALSLAAARSPANRPLVEPAAKL